MITHNLIQGSQEWHAYRAAHDNASDAPVMMGCSAYKTREQLLAERATGITPEVDSATQRRFDAGHRFEALARPLAEAIIGEDLYPVTGSLEGSRLSASFDGLTLLEDVALEHKTLNQRLRAALEVPGCTGADLPMEYQIQMEQQCAVSGCERILFMASAWDSDDQLIEALHCWYTPNLELRARILAGWEQFHKDVATYVPPEPKPAPVVAEPMESLPAVSMRLDGKLAVVSNLPDFATALRAFIERIPAKPDTDQDFANAEAACKSLKRAEDALTAGEDAALGEMVDFEAMRRQVRDLKDLARATRLATEKLVTARKEQIRGEIVAGGVAALRDHIASLNTRLGKPYMPQVPADFGGVVKGKRTVDSLRGAVNDELARIKIAANEIADRIQVNLNTLRELASAHAFLFADTASIVLKQPEDLTMLVKARIAEHDAAEAARIEQETGRKPGKKETRELKDEAKLDLLPMAFTKQASTWVWIDREARTLVLDTGSQSRADLIVTALVELLPGLSVSLLNTQDSPQAAMAHWLSQQDPPTGFGIDRECELKACDESKAVVKYGRHPLEIAEVQAHIAAGKLPTKLALTWDDRVSFVMTDGLVLKKIAFLDTVFEGTKADDGSFDTDVAIMAGELCNLIPDLIKALGGEAESGVASAAQSCSTEAADTAEPQTPPPDPYFEGGGPDQLYERACAFVVSNDKASISFVQRMLRIGYNRAARLLEDMEKAGIVSRMGPDGGRSVIAP